MPAQRLHQARALDVWTSALLARHTGPLTRPELLRAVRALSARYVEHRRELPGRSPVDSAGKRAAFAVLYGPIHYATTAAIVEGLGLAGRVTPRIVDLGCGTGAASAGWAGTLDAPATLHGIDRNAWAVAEARWTWRTLGLQGRAHRGDLVRAARRLLDPGERVADGTAVLAAYAVNELGPEARRLLLASLVALGRRGAAVLVIEPVSGRAAPWFDDWARAFTTAGGRADAWRFPNRLPPVLQALDRDAGFDRPELTARSLCLIPGL